jgi:hypothetical protein
VELTVSPEFKRQWDELIKQLQDPFKLRIVSLTVVCLLGMFVVYRPLGTEITILRRDVRAAQGRVNTIHRIEALRAARTRLLKNLPENSDVNFWTQHYLAGIRQAGVNLRSLESIPKKTKVGSLRAVYLDIEFDGTYEQVYRMIDWIEHNEWFTRILRFGAKKKSDVIEGRLTAAILVSQKKISHGS